VIEYESNNVKKLFFEGKVTKFIKDQAIVICKKLISFGLNRYEYKQIDGNIVNINTETKFCSCRFFNDKAICKNLVSACMNDDVELYGLIPKSKKFKFLRRRLIRPLDDSIEVNNEVVDNIEPQDVIGDTATNDIVTDVINKVVKVTKALKIDDPVVEVIANKRGRPYVS